MLAVCVNQDPGVRPGSRKGAAVHVDAMRRAFRRTGAKVLTFDEDLSGDRSDALERACRAGGVDLLYERYALDRPGVSELAERLRIPYVLEVNAPLIEEAERHRAARTDAAAADAERRVMQRADLVVAVSREVADHCRVQGVSEQRILVAPNAVDTDRFHPGLRPHPSLADRIDPGNVVLGFHGRLRPWHGFPQLVDAAALLHTEGLPVHLLLVGHGSFAEGVGDRLPRSRWTHVEWVPHETVGHYVRRFDVLPLTYPDDQPIYFSPLKLTEAMACGAVPVVPDVGDLPELVGHEVDGLVYEHGSADGLLSSLRRLLLDLALRERLGRTAASAASLRTWERIAREVIARVNGAVSR